MKWLPSLAQPWSGDRKPPAPIILAILAGVAAILLGVAFVLFYGLFIGTGANAVAGLLLSGASLVVGILLGFLFGIPRSLQSDIAPQRNTSVDGTDHETQRVRYGANTNLEQISDWLTKILVGVGLTQLVSLPSILDRAGSFFGVAIGNHEGASVIAVLIIIFFTVSGFLFGYLWTRLFLGSEFARADLNALQERVNEISEAQQQSQVDGQALYLTFSYLNTSDGARISLLELKHSVIAASASVQRQILAVSASTRATHWQRYEDKPVLDRTVPIFEALIESDKDDRFHEYHGQLGYALKDKRRPDYGRAENELTKAIEIRGPNPSDGGELYEINRAICRIMLDQDFLESKQSEKESRIAIISDLRIGAEVEPDLFNDDRILQWMRLNGIDDLRENPEIKREPAS